MGKHGAIHAMRQMVRETGMSDTLGNLHGAWHGCTFRERAEFMEAVGLRDKEKRDEAQEPVIEAVPED